MPTADLVDTIGAEGRRLLDFARRDPERIVPQYPTWTLQDLVVHVASIHARTIAVCASLPQERILAPELPAGRHPFEWYAETLAGMLAALRDADPGATVWFFTADRTVGAWKRRMLIETGVHRWDAQQTVESPDPLLPVVAVSGLDEFGDMWLPRLGDLPRLELTATDLRRSWTFGIGDRLRSVSGTVSDLYLSLMDRPGLQLPAGWDVAVSNLATPAD